MDLRTTPLDAEHRALGAKMAGFAGWQMPLHYPAGAIEEHRLVRHSAGLFDISHMGRIEVHGHQAVDALSHLLTADIRRLAPFEACYALLCGPDGGILDDVFVYRLADRCLVVVNAANCSRDLAHMREHSAGFAAAFRDITSSTAMLALQGPSALAAIEPLLGRSVDWPRLYLHEGVLHDAPVLLCRTGYTGEDGLELICPADTAVALWRDLLEAADTAGIQAGPAGLAARDSLRFEPGFPLYGNELTPHITPVEARLMWACRMDHEFIGREAIIERKASPAIRLVSFVMEQPGVPRHGCEVYSPDGQRIGWVTSGLRAPSLNAFAGNAYVETAWAGRDQELLIEIRGSRKLARTARRPLYRPSYRASRLPAQPEYGELVQRHIGPTAAQRDAMLKAIGCPDMPTLIQQTIPDDILHRTALRLPAAAGEQELQAELAAIAGRNIVHHPLIGQGYYGTILPAVIRRNILENPAWYTQYTPYQAEISQGRLEALLNFQTMIIDLTGLEAANASLLDEATAAAEAMLLCRRAMPRSSTADHFFLDAECHPQTLEVVSGRAEAQGIHLVVGNTEQLMELLQHPDRVFGGLFQYPGSTGAARIPREEIQALHDAGALAAVAADPLALTLLPEPAAFGADIAIGSTQRFGQPLGFGGPHAAYIAARDGLLRQIPGRLVGVSRDRLGNSAIRLALQTREQHIRRDRATSNICTAQVLPAILASMYAVYHGADGLREIATRIRRYTWAVAELLRRRGYQLSSLPGFDTITITGLQPEECRGLMMRAEHLGYLLRRSGPRQLSLSLDETVAEHDIVRLLQAFPVCTPDGRVSEHLFSITCAELEQLLDACPELPAELQRRSSFLQAEAFIRGRSETEIQRYMARLQQRDLSLTHSMIPLGSCTMKLNPAIAMEAITLPGFANLHPFAPAGHARGYRDLIAALSDYLARITGLPGVTMQPNSGAQGEYAGLMIIRAYHRSRGDQERTICLVPDSAHGTNPASAVMAGYRVVTLPSAANGSIDLAALDQQLQQHADSVGAIMITYPSTHGVFDENIRAVTRKVHDAGGQVYLDGANLNAMVGLSSPAAVGADVCHLNLHKTFAIPHGGGGPGMGPVCTAAHLIPFLPPQGYYDTAAAIPDGDPPPAPPVSAAPFGSPGILPITYAYIRMMGPAGLRLASETAVLNANYIAARLQEHYPISYRNARGRVAHECILDLRQLQKHSGITVEDVAKRLIDYGFHAPTMSWPEPGTLMIEPTESESLPELDRFCAAMIAIRQEIQAVTDGAVDRDNNLLRNAPHTLAELTAADWPHPYSREQAAFPLDWVREHKFWPAVARVDNVFGDRHPVCACPM
ncbi:aminomethyl-transferring glycine dehydrogenase [Spirochaeta africana]|uniref:Glycine cleavage system T protein n=1 Tax=Spirochaeta africana (strain ATCC 700263 / DSM 8902 / Z-7692) TaxID=889378 RepID=H9UGE1_SPIAZ|nr:aminomethyl-transferring glycine dehydrogenase [Spirochaeta africana]AFG36584.1 glycine dehydrogenase, decarboxylating [Spirochaeta africana DSM 8902]